jgi:indolepyruvate ferredoxin oxidoreductase alpha subunit
VVIDASAATTLCLTSDGFDLVSHDLQAPILLRSEALAGIQGMQWREDISAELATAAVGRLLRAPISLIRRTEVLTEARRLALEFGWAKTYDAEYVALAQLSHEPLLTIDARLARRIGDLVEVKFPSAL